MSTWNRKRSGTPSGFPPIRCFMGNPGLGVAAVFVEGRAASESADQCGLPQGRRSFSDDRSHRYSPVTGGLIPQSNGTHNLAQVGSGRGTNGAYQAEHSDVELDYRIVKQSLNILFVYPNR